MGSRSCREHFLPDRNKKPEQLMQRSEEKKTGAQVPAAGRPTTRRASSRVPTRRRTRPSCKTPQKDDKNPLDPSNWPDWLRWLFFFVVVPLLVVLLVYGAIRGAKWLRRRRRRTTGETASRVSGGWREVVDTARDLRMPLPVKGTRLEQARALEEHVFGPAAREAEPGRRRCPHGRPRPRRVLRRVLTSPRVPERSHTVP